MPGSGGSITYKSVVITLLSAVVALISFIGGGALIKLDRLELAVMTLQTTRTVDDIRIADLVKKVELLTERQEVTDRQLTPQVEFLTKWLVDTFGAPKPKSKPRFDGQ